MSIYEKLTNMIIEECDEENTFLRVIFKAYGTPGFYSPSTSKFLTLTFVVRKLMSPELHVYVDIIPADQDRGWSEGAIRLLFYFYSLE